MVWWNAVSSKGAYIHPNCIDHCLRTGVFVIHTFAQRGKGILGFKTRQLHECSGGVRIVIHGSGQPRPTPHSLSSQLPAGRASAAVLVMMVAMMMCTGQSLL